MFAGHERLRDWRLTGLSLVDSGNWSKGLMIFSGICFNSVLIVSSLWLPSQWFYSFFGFIQLLYHFLVFLCVLALTPLNPRHTTKQGIR